MSKDHGHRFAVYSPTGVHIGLWSDGLIAAKVLSEGTGNTIEELVTRDLALAMVAKAREDALREAAEILLGTIRREYGDHRDYRKAILAAIEAPQP